LIKFIDVFKPFLLNIKNYETQPYAMAENIRKGGERSRGNGPLQLSPMMMMMMIPASSGREILGVFFLLLLLRRSLTRSAARVEE
jgi:hypothetical protein